jgi:hypothetical protein
VLVTREELYDQVWREPMTRLAKRYGVSDVALGKTCRKLNVPVPPRGHWAKLQHGKPSPRTPLPPAHPKAAQVADITASPRVGTTKVEPVVAAAIEAEGRPENRVVVAERLTNPHPTVRATAAALAGAQVDAYGMITPRFLPEAARDPAPLSIRVGPAMRVRALRVADALLKALDARGHKLDPGTRPDPRQGGRGRAPAVIVEGERITFLIEEKADRHDHVPTAAELAEMKRWSWRTPPKWDYVPSGKLSLRIDVGIYLADRIRKRWSDGRGGAIGDNLNEIIVAFVEVGAALRRHREEEARKEAERQERARQRQEAERRGKVEEARRKDLEGRAEAWSRAEAVRRFVAEVERRARTEGGTPSPELLEWLVWARAHAERLDPLAQGVDALLRDQEAAASKPPEPAYPWLRQPSA